MTIKGTKDLGKVHIDRICSLVKELDRIGSKYCFIITARNMTEYDRCKKEWAGFKEFSNYLQYKMLIVNKPKEF
jgi:hypothetical protein